MANLVENGLTHSLKKSPEKKSKKRKGDSEESDKKKKKKEKGKESNLKNAATSALTAKVLNDEKLNAEQRKLGMNANLKSLFTSGSSGPGKNTDFMTRGYTVPVKK